MESAINKMKRMMQLLTLRADEKKIVSFKQVKIVIYTIAGIDKRTIKVYIEALNELGWLKRLNRHQFRISSDYMTEDF